MNMKYIFPAALLMVLGACAGFEPLYGENTSVRRGFDRLSLSPIEGRSGFLFAQALMDRGGVNTGTSGEYVLETTLRKNQTNVGVRVDDVSTRARLIMSATYSLRDRNGKIAYQGSSEGISAFDVPDEPYGALIAEQDAEESAALILAEKVLNDLAVFFASAPENK